MVYFTSSWDDGSVYDFKLAELLSKYGHRATFFVPLANIENRTVIKPEQIVELSKSFEIGAHTLNHNYLTRIQDSEAEHEIKISKSALEQITGRPVNGFCFPGGKFKPVHLTYVKEAGFKYARTVDSFKYTSQLPLMHTTLHAADHSKITYFGHLLKRGYYKEIARHTRMILRNNNWTGMMLDMINSQLENDTTDIITVIHLWGHSWEFEQNNSWGQLSAFLADLAAYDLPILTNYEISQLTNKNSLNEK
jgi:peptidoglycan/xylan/chitin deacetylase (PgdA/CDA1 family)